MSKEEILAKSVEFYLNSSDFNGIPILSLRGDIDENDFKEDIEQLVKEECVELVFGDVHCNPHIKALDTESIDIQIEKIDSDIFNDACVYPTPRVLKSNIDESAYISEPFTLKIAQGKPQLSSCSFELSVLEAYKNDPRYIYEFTNISGYISISDDFFESEDMKTSDKVLLKSFSISIDEDKNIYVIAFLRDLSRLSKEHQLIWNAKIVTKETCMHPDFFRMSIQGNIQSRLSLFQATLYELELIHEVSLNIKEQSLFLNNYSNKNCPREFGYLLRSTQNEYLNFVHTLDKMFSENLNKKFFGDEIELNEEIERKDGKVQVQPKGTIRLLIEWLLTFYEPVGTNDFHELDSVLRKIRKIRQKPAHDFSEDKFDGVFIKEQIKLMHEYYRALKILRCVLLLHPNKPNVTINEYIRDSLIWSF